MRTNHKGELPMITKRCDRAHRLAPVPLKISGLFAGLSIAVVLMACAAAAHAQEARRIKFPVTKEGMQVLSVDTHTHTVFSDGYVWPNIRVEEAERDGLDVLAVTDHVESQPKYRDIPNPDANRSFQLAQQAAADAHLPLLVVPGAEIARRSVPVEERYTFHFNALFVKDVNPLRHRDTRFPIEGQALPLRDALESVKAAKQQGAFIIWNHPILDSSAHVDEYHRKLLESGTIDGIEVGSDYTMATFRIALDNHLAVIGSSDIHGLIDQEIDAAHGQQRSVTLVLAKGKNEAAVRAAFEAHRTVVLRNHTLIGREQDVRPIVEASLSVRFQPKAAVIENKASSPFSLRAAGTAGGGAVFTVPAHGKTTVSANHLSATDVASKRPLSLEFEVLNALIAPGQVLSLTLTQ